MRGRVLESGSGRRRISEWFLAPRFGLELPLRLGLILGFGREEKDRPVKADMRLRETSREEAK